MNSNPFENFLKGPVTSTLGLVLMIFSSALMLTNYLGIKEGCIIFVGGFSILFIKDELPSFIKRFFEKRLK